MKYYFNDPVEGQIEVEPERWEWGVLYKPTPEQIKKGDAEKAGKEEGWKDELRELKNERAQFKMAEDESNRAEIVSIERRIIEREQWIGLPPQYEQDELLQFGTDGVFHRVGEIEQERVQNFSLFKPDSMMKDRIDIVVTEGMRLIHKYRNVKPYYMDSYVKVYMFGYKQDGRHHYNFILPDDRIIQSNVENVDLPNFALNRK